ncbi:MAG: hypothetical protein MPW15_14045 [Candidatus Manganitrophus sp.]|nr:hypothetical protein [Candidatus Manganitrophus sp.]
MIGLLFSLSNRFFAQISSQPRRSRILIGAVLVAALFMVLTAQQVWLRRGLTLVLILMTLYHLRHVPLRGKPFPPKNRERGWRSRSAFAPWRPFW